MADSCDAVDRELERVLGNFSAVHDHVNRAINKQIDFVRALKQEFEEGEEKL